MLTIIRKSDNQPCGTVPSSMTVEQEILLNVIPNFGGNVEDYGAVEYEPPRTDPTIVTEPVDEEKAAMAEAIIDMDARLTALENK